MSGFKSDPKEVVGKKWTNISPLKVTEKEMQKRAIIDFSQLLKTEEEIQSPIKAKQHINALQHIKDNGVRANDDGPVLE